LYPKKNMLIWVYRIMNKIGILKSIWATRRGDLIII
jgi:hypothetical protein